MAGNRPTDEDFLVGIEPALEANLLPEPGLEVLQRTRDAVLVAVVPLVAQLRHTPAAALTRAAAAVPTTPAVAGRMTRRRTKTWRNPMSYPQLLTAAEKIRAWLDGLLPAASPFVLRRNEDVTGVSGTGIVADGVMFPAAGKSVCVVRWRGERGSTVVWDHLGHVKDIHGHDGRTVIELVPVGELIAALKEITAIGSLIVDGRADAQERQYCEGWNQALTEVHGAITDAIEALHDHDGEVSS